jgi:hypothetical protein
MKLATLPSGAMVDPFDHSHLRPENSHPLSPQTWFQIMKLNAVHRELQSKSPFGERPSDTLKRREHSSRPSRLRRSMRSECLRFSDRRTESVALCSCSWLQQEGRPWGGRIVIGAATGAARDRANVNSGV